MIRLAAVAVVLLLLVGPVGDAIVRVIEVGYQTRELNTRLAVSVAAQTGAEVVSASEYAANREER